VPVLPFGVKKAEPGVPLLMDNGQQRFVCVLVELHLVVIDRRPLSSSDHQQASPTRKGCAVVPREAWRN
jgi:hypothetical protein